MFLFEVNSDNILHEGEIQTHAWLPKCLQT